VLEEQEALTSRFAVTLTSRKRGAKRLGTLESSSDAQVLGRLQSPLEERRVILVLRTGHGFEGTHVCRVEALGARLSSGFKPPGKSKRP
jgi:hypothetical protein